MTKIIPNAAYLWNEIVCLSDADGELAYLTGDGFQIVSVTSSDEVVLLYAPGDDVNQARFGVGREIQTLIKHKHQHKTEEQA